MSELSETGGGQHEMIQAGDLAIDLSAHRVLQGEREVALKPKEWDLLVFLTRHRGQVCTTDQILEAVWGYDYVGDSRTVAVHVHGLREKVESDPGHPRLIETIRGVGYRFSG